MNRRHRLIADAAVTLMVIFTMAMLVSTCDRYSKINDTKPTPTIMLQDSIADGQR